jgi:hypothetical protein
MNKKEHLLVCLMEECAEVQKVCAKILRFGINDSYNGGPTNRVELIHEITDLIAVAQMLKDEGLTEINGYAEDTKKKKDKLEHWMKYSISKGTLNE